MEAQAEFSFEENDIPLDLERGEACPTCRQLAKKYKRKLYSTMVLALICIYRKQYQAGEEWIHFKEIFDWNGIYVGGDMNKLPYWGLIEQRSNTCKTKRRSGYWRITQKGMDFVLRKHKVPSHINLYNQGFLGFSGDDIDIVDALGKNFNYQELMWG